jgi:hypothetical protein
MIRVRGWYSWYGRFKSLLSPSYLGPRQDRWRALLAGCSKTKNSNILILNELGTEVFASRRMNYRLLRKTTQEFAYLFGTFLVFFGNNRKRKLCLLTSGTPQPRRAGRITGVVFILEIRFSAGFSLSIQGGVFWNFFGLKVSQFASLPEIANLAFQRFHLPAELLA